VRSVHDFIHINEMSTDDTNDVPSTDYGFSVISKKGARIYSKIDLRSAYLQILLRQCDRSITAFTFKGVRYRFVTAALGLKHIPSIFQRMIRSLLQAHGCSDFTHNHIDDVIIYSKDIEEHKQHCIKVLNAFTSVSLTIAISG